MHPMVLSPQRAKLVTAALLAAPPANPWATLPAFGPPRMCFSVITCHSTRYPHSGAASGTNKSVGHLAASRNEASSNAQSTESSKAQYAAQDFGDSSRSRRPQKSVKTASSGTFKHQGCAAGAGPGAAANAGGGAHRNTNSSRTQTGRQTQGFAPVSSPLPDHVPVLVVGAGAAGLTAAYFAAQAGVKVVVLERTREAGKKVLMSGGTRCNVLPLEVDLALDYVTSSSRSALRAVFSSWELEECHQWLSRDIGLHLVLEQDTRKWFPASNSGREVRDRLVVACQDLGVQFVYNASVQQITPPQQQIDNQQQQQHKQIASSADGYNSQPSSSTTTTSSSRSGGSSGGSNGCWRVHLDSQETVTADCVVLSTGGYSFPAVGTDGTGLRILTGLGHKLSAGGCYAALTPLKGPHPGGEQLAGLTLSSVQLSVLKGGTKKILAAAQRGGMLFTHKGYSGPAVLDVSHWLVKELEQPGASGQHSPRKTPRSHKEKDEFSQPKTSIAFHDQVTCEGVPQTGAHKKGLIGL